MKFKFIFALFNGIIIFSFLFIFFMPVFILGSEYTLGFWGQNWYLILIFLAVLTILDLYFFVNWKLFHFLEKEDWSGLSALLEKRVLQKKRFSEQNLRLLANSYVVQGKPLDILKIEGVLKETKPSLIRKFALILGVPHLLKADSADMLAFFQPLALDQSGPVSPWLKFNYAFSLLSAQRLEEAAQVLKEIAGQKKERLVQLLALYLLDTNAPAPAAGLDEKSLAKLKSDQEDFKKALSPSAFERLRTQEQENLQVVILNSVINESFEWLYGGKK